MTVGLNTVSNPEMTPEMTPERRSCGASAN
jgi:hypothetical protein